MNTIRGVPRISTKRHHNLPAHRVRLIGREQDLATARQALLDAEGRLLTLTGTGGCGKTRLALELAANLLPHFQGGVWLVELGAIADPEQVGQAIASVFGVHERSGESLIATLVRSLSRRELLLVLDNCEHVVEKCAQVAEQLLDDCPRLRVLATSREALQISGEKTWRVPSLAVPDPRAATDDLLRSPAVQLFVERAQAAAPDFVVTANAAVAVGHICTRLNGLPLAIELAAARVSALGVEQIFERLEDSIRLLVRGRRTAPTRQQSLRATLDWSYGLLSDSERAVFRRLAVFADGCSLNAAEAVCADHDIATSDVLDLVQRLVDKSLVTTDQRDSPLRYRLLEPVRQYAQMQLVSSGERDVVRRRHALYYLTFGEARARDTNIGGPRRFTATSELADEYPNLRSTLAWSLEKQEAQIGLRLAVSLLFLWQIHSSVNEGLAWLGELLALPGADEPTAARSGALVTAARLAQSQGNSERAWAFCNEALLLARRLGDPLLEYLALMFSANNGVMTGEVEIAEQFAREALACASRAGDPIGEGQATMLLALSACTQADYRTAQPLAQRALWLARAGRDAWNEGWALAVVGRAALGAGAVEDARVALQAGLSMAVQQGEPLTLTPLILDALGEVETALGQPRRAHAWLVRSLEVRHNAGELGEIGRTLDRMAALAASRAQPERAARLAGAADAQYGTRRTPADRGRLERWLLPVRRELGQERADKAWAEGRALELEDAIALALGGDEPDAEPPAAALPAHPAAVLTAREQEVATLLARGLSNRQIAEQLVVTPRTVASHIEHILHKLGFASRHQVGAWAEEHGLQDELGDPYRQFADLC